MNQSLLTQLSITPEQAAKLPSSPRSRLLNFLLRWEQYDEALACLNASPATDLVSVQDLRARALEGLDRYPEAIAVMTERLRQKESIPARSQLARLYLAAGEVDQAFTLATALTTGDEVAGMSWSLLGDVHLARGDLAASEAGYLRHQELAPNSRQPHLGLMRIHHRRGNPITAAAYAVRAFTVEEGEYELPIYALRELRDFFATTGDENHERTANEQLAQRFAAELAEMGEIVAAGLEPRTVRATRPAPTSERPRPAPPRRPANPPQVTDLTTIPVSVAERTTLAAAVQQHFGFASLRPAQVEIMACALRGENVLTILPTGAGKSLCYQLPALLDEGVTLVVSPLIALMKDQIDNLPPAIQAQAIALNSTLDGTQLEIAMRAVAAGKYKLIYAAPERLRQRPFLHTLQRAGLRRLVIDEAHCVSSWGHDFRPDYLYLAEAHRELGAPPLLALTATAPLRVRQDIERQLFRLQTTTAPDRLRLIASDIYRPNLHLHVIKTSGEDGKLRHLLDLCSALPGSGIVYARTRQNSEELAALLGRYGISAECYHAGLANRAAVQERFMRSETRIIVATVAFGMGVDKPDIRFILHYGLPDAVEAYYQEVGRAGRDGQPATCVLLYANSDKATLTRHANEGLLTKEYLRAVYGAVRTRLAGRTTAALALDDLQRDLKATEDTPVRVALSVLEQVGLIQRHADVPRTVTLQWSGAPEAALTEFATKARLRPQQKVDRPYMELATTVELVPEQLEAQLLTWDQAGLLTYQPSGRNLLLSLRPAPAEVSQAIDSLLDQFATIQRQRVTEMVDYARDTHCRHGYLANYLGGLPREACGACDNCGAPPLPTSPLALPDEADQRRTILNALSKHSWGKINLVNLLRGDTSVGDRGRASPVFGALPFRSETALGQLIDELAESGAVRRVELTNGGVALELTPQGRALQEGRRGA